jgi:single-strand DNA-binding protein
MFRNNSVTLRGNLGKDVEYINFGEGKTLAKFRLATNKIFYDQHGEKVKQTIWHNIIAWGKLADLMTRELSKGSGVTVFGELITRQYEDKTGTVRQLTEVKAHDFMHYVPLGSLAAEGRPALPF